MVTAGCSLRTISTLLALSSGLQSRAVCRLLRSKGQQLKMVVGHCQQQWPSLPRPTGGPRRGPDAGQSERVHVPQPQAIPVPLLAEMSMARGNRTGVLATPVGPPDWAAGHVWLYERANAAPDVQFLSLLGLTDWRAVWRAVWPPAGPLRPRPTLLSISITQKCLTHPHRHCAWLI